MHAACVFFFCPILMCFLQHDFVKLPPFRNSYPGSHSTHSSPFPTTVLAFVLIAKKKGSELGFLPWRPLASNWCAFIHATYQHDTQHAGCEALSAVSSYMRMVLFQALVSTRTNTYVIPSYNLLVVCIISCDISHDIGIEISRTCSRY